MNFCKSRGWLYTLINSWFESYYLLNIALKFALVLKSRIIYHHFTAFLFLAVLLTQTFSKSIIVVGYFTNTKTYAQNCENKSRPQMHCNGKCQIMKKLKQEESKDKQNPNRRTDEKDEVLSSKSFFPSLIIEGISLNISYPSVESSFAISCLSCIFHPPQGGYSLNSEV